MAPINAKSKFGFAHTSFSKKGLLTALSATTTIGVFAFLVAAMYPGGSPAEAKRLQKDSAVAEANYRQSPQQSISAAAPLLNPQQATPESDRRDSVSFHHRRGTY